MARTGDGTQSDRGLSRSPALYPLTDVTDSTQPRAVADLRRSEERYRTVVDALDEGLLILRLDGSVETVNGRARQLLRIPPETPEEVDLIESISGFEVIDEEFSPIDFLDLPTWGTLATGTESHKMVVGFRWAPDDIAWIDISTHPLGSGEDRRAIVTLRDISDRRSAEQSNSEYEKRVRHLAGIVESTSDLIGSVDPTTSLVTYLNEAARTRFGLTEADAPSTDFRSICTPRSARLWEDEILPTLRTTHRWSGEMEMIDGDRLPLDVVHTMTAEFPGGSQDSTVSFLGRDVTEQRQREIELAYQATHDALTDLPNRALILTLAEVALDRRRTTRGTVALLFLDLDRFKQVNDSLGHTAGDEILIEAGERIRSVLRPADSLARIGGDEFVVLCENVVGEDDAIEISRRVEAAIDAQPFRAAGATVRMTVSVGIALSGGEAVHPESLLRDADAAMYRAKERGRARHELFDDHMRQKALDRNDLTDELATAIQRGQIEVYYQPIIDLASGRVDGVEALARWRHPERGILPPGEFIPLAEETGLIVGLGMSVLSRSADQARRWEVEMGSRAPKVHVNLSARQLAHADLPELVAGVIEHSLIDPDRLCLEVTESVVMEDAAHSVDVLARLKDLGVELAIDDFGTGYSSLAYLSQFPVDVLKVDRSFVRDLGRQPHDASIVAIIINLAHSLGLTCVAEGVETLDQLAGLRHLGCAHAQGFYFARPHPVPDVNRYLSTVFDVEEADRPN